MLGAIVATLLALNIDNQIMGVVELHHDRMFVVLNTDCQVLAKGTWENPETYHTALRKLGLHAVTRGQSIAETMCRHPNERTDRDRD